MKISIGSKVINGPFGGGNEYIKNLISFLEIKGHIVINHLNDDDIDIILLTSPFLDSQTSTFSNYEIDFYQKFVNSSTISFQRINECDERKKTNHINKQIVKSNKNIDCTFFVSSWLKSIFENIDISFKDSFVVMGGPNKNIFNSHNKIYWSSSEPLKIVTHHWSNNFMKGFDIYLKLDQLINENKSEDFEFTFIGNLPKDFKFKNTKIFEPLVGEDLSKELKKHHIYITASKNEPSGNHHMEGALCGLPILYLNSGALPEYCSDYGIELDTNNIFESILKIKKNYRKIVNKLDSYPFDFESSANILLNEFENAYANKHEITKKRNQTSRTEVFFNLYMFKTKAMIFKFYISFRKLLAKILNKHE